MQQMTPLHKLRMKLEEIDGLSNQYWTEQLNERKKAEIQFHDKHRNWSEVDKFDQDTFDRFYGNKKYYKSTEDSKNYARKWIEREAKGRVFLDYACGDGQNAVLAARSRAALAVGIDISSVSIENARRASEAEGVAARTFFCQTDAEDTRLPTNSVDRAVCSGVLHHLDLSYAFPELRRILKPGGKLLAIEALDYNPAIKLYRRMTPDMRTEWEKSHILSLEVLRFVKQFFEVGEVRYWHIAGIRATNIPQMTPALCAVDSVLTRIPGIQLMAWIFTFELVKPED